MHTILFNSYRKFQKENKDNFAKAIFKLPLTAKLLFGGLCLTLMGNLLAIFIPIIKYTYLTCFIWHGCKYGLCTQSDYYTWQLSHIITRKYRVIVEWWHQSKNFKNIKVNKIKIDIILKNCKELWHGLIKMIWKIRLFNKL